MIQKLYLLLFLLLGICVTGMAQVTLADVAQLQNTAKYTGTQEELVKLLAMNVRYPAIVQRANKVGTVVGVLKIAKNGEIVEVGTLNKAQPELKAEFERVALLTKHKWIIPNDTAAHYYAIIPLQFNIVGRGYKLNSEMKPDFFQETIVATASGVAPDKIAEAERQGAALYQRMEDELVAKVNTYVQEEDFDGAIKVLEELVNLQPLHTAYYQPLITLHERTGNEQEAAYYRAVVQLFAK